ncbi:MAG: SCP2 sterol-binding domain-containing protein [Gammaproteobacteria bacterium]|nr:SCP2 sterol-binding domain-containing protein [Gammaproteobacteria bacterium]
MKLPRAITATLEKGLNALIDLDPDSKSRLAGMQGQVVQLKLKGLDLDVFLFIHADGIEVMADFDGEVDTVIAGTPASMLAMRTSNRGLFSGDVEISGNVETGKKFKRYLDALDIDWEEQFAHVVGDSAAYQFGLVFRNIRDFAGKTAESLRQNMAEYLVEESQLSAPKSEIDHFVEDVDKLRESVDRLEARLVVLEKQREKSV